jgi:hypothetical protein
MQPARRTSPSSPDHLQQLVERKLPMRLIGQDPRRVIVANDAAASTPCRLPPASGEKKAGK